jgi:hypothetical protein
MHPKYRQRGERSVLFSSPKCRSAIPVNDSLLCCALEQASLDSSVRQIEYRSGPHVDRPAISLAGVVLQREDGAHLLRVHASRPERTEEEHARLRFALGRYGLQLLELDARDLHREPLFSNVRAIWAHAGRPVSLMDRLKIAVALEEGGTQTIVDLENRAGLTSEIVPIVCALACEDLLRLNIYDAELSSRTLVLGP